jgi:hypothetical protein
MINKPAHCNNLHPRAYKRGSLAKEKQPIVPVSQGYQGCIKNIFKFIQGELKTDFQK